MSMLNSIFLKTSIHLNLSKITVTRKMFKPILVFIFVLSIFIPASHSNKTHAACVCEGMSPPYTCSSDCNNVAGQTCTGAVGECQAMDSMNDPEMDSCGCFENDGVGLCSGHCTDSMVNRPCVSDGDCTVLANSRCSLCSAVSLVMYTVLPWVFGIGVLLAIIFLVIGAIRYMNAGDDPKKIADAKGTITWTIIGFLLLIFAAAIIRLIWYFFGLDANGVFKIPLTADSDTLDCCGCGSRFDPCP